jgi:hypothetical protein
MELDVTVAGKSLSIPIPDPFRLDLEALVVRIETHLASQGAAASGLDFRGLVPKLVKGIAGCEGGCPADAQKLVSRGFTNFKLAYIEGGILQAKVKTGNGMDVSLRMFPDF